MTTDPISPAEPPRLFVYGTLAPGHPNQHVLADVPGTWEPASIHGHLVHDGWGSALGYPALILHVNTTEVVSGMLLTSNALPEHWDRIDEFEGDGYLRATVNVTVADGTRRSAQAYLLRHA